MPQLGWLGLFFNSADLRTERGYIIVVLLHAEGKRLSADTPMGSTCILANKTRLVAPFYDGYISIVLWTVTRYLDGHASLVVMIPSPDSHVLTRNLKFRSLGGMYFHPMAFKSCSSSIVSSWTHRPLSASVSLPHIAPSEVFLWGTSEVWVREGD